MVGPRFPILGEIPIIWQYFCRKLHENAKKNGIGILPPIRQRDVFYFDHTDTRNKH